MAVIELSETHWMKESNGGHPDWVKCDFCNGDALDDFQSGKVDPRLFYQQHGGVDDGLVVCEACVQAFLSEPPT